jgi:hypothetical protein
LSLIGFVVVVVIILLALKIISLEVWTLFLFMDLSWNMLGNVFISGVLGRREMCHKRLRMSQANVFISSVLGRKEMCHKRLRMSQASWLVKNVQTELQLTCFLGN